MLAFTVCVKRQKPEITWKNANQFGLNKNISKFVACNYLREVLQLENIKFWKITFRTF